MAGATAYQTLRRQLLSRNPYFQADVVAARRRLGIPALGFSAAVFRLSENRHPAGVTSGEPNLEHLLSQARGLGLPLEEVLNNRRQFYRRRGIDFDQLVGEQGWWALPIFWLQSWIAHWYAKERIKAGVERKPVWTGGLPASVMEALIHLMPPQVAAAVRETLPTTIDVRLPIGKEALSLARRYQLGEDYADAVESMLLGEPGAQARTEADLIYAPRTDGAGMVIVLSCVPYSIAVAEWDRLFQEAIRPALLESSGRVSRDVPFVEGLKEATRKARPGRPPYSHEKLEDDWRLWMFCHERGLLPDVVNEAAFDAYLDSLAPEEHSKVEDMEPQVFVRTVRRLDALLRPTDHPNEKSG